MFNVHRLSSKNISIRNLVLLFFTIVFGFASVITLAQISIPSSINNAWQTIGRVTITSDGTDSGTRLLDFNYDDNNHKTFIETSVLTDKGSFSGKVLGIDNNGDLIYTYSQNLVISGGGGAGGDVYRTGAGRDIRNLNGGDIGIGTENMSGKVHIQSSTQTELYLEETSSGSAANINFENPTRTRALGGDSDPDIFYIGEAGGAIDFSINPIGNIGIGVVNPTDNKLQIIGNITSSGFIARGNLVVAGGTSSTAMGYQSNAIGDVSTAMGMQTNATAQYSTAMGLGTWATGYTSTAMGQNTHAAGQYSTSMGSATNANGWYSTAMGSNTHANANSSTAMGNNNVGYADSLLEVGMGGFTTPGNAFTVRAVGGIKVGDSGVTCAGDKLGTIKFVGDNFYGCKSSGWVLLN